MADADKLDLLRQNYQQALASYEAASSTLNHHLRSGTVASAADVQRERDARTALETARRQYLDAWLVR